MFPTYNQQNFYPNTLQYREEYQMPEGYDNQNYYYENELVKPENFEAMLSHSRYGTADTDVMGYDQDIQMDAQLPQNQYWNDNMNNYMPYQTNPDYIPNPNPSYYGNQYVYNQTPALAAVQASTQEETQENLKIEAGTPCKDQATWEEADGSKLLNLTKKFKNNWERICREFLPKKYTPTFLKKKYSQLTSMQTAFPRRIKFSEAEDLVIVKGYLEHETDWELISSKLVNRTGEMVKNRFYNHIKKKNLYDDLVRRVQAGEIGIILKDTENVEEQEDLANEEAESEVPESPEQAKIAPVPQKYLEFIKSQEFILTLMKQAHGEIKDNSWQANKQEIAGCVVMLEKTLNENLAMMQTLREKLNIKY